MSHIDPIDQLFKERLQNATLDIDASVWKQIDQKRKPKPNLGLRPFIWFAVLTTIGISASLLNQNSSLFQFNDVAQAVVIETQSNKAASIAIMEHETEETIEVEENETPLLASASSDKESLSLIEKTQNKQKKIAEISSTKETRNKQIKETTKTSNNNSVTPKSKIKLIETSARVAQPSDGYEISNQSNLKYEDRKEITGLTQSSITQFEHNQLLASNTLASSSGFNKLNQQVAPFIANVPFGLRYGMRNHLMPNQPSLNLGQFGDDYSCAKFSPKDNYFYFDLLVGPEYALRKMEIKNEEYIEYLEQREETESYDFAYTAGARLSYVMENGIAFRLGFMYSELTEKFDLYDPDYELITETHLTIDTIQTPSGPTYVYDTLKVVQTGELYLTKYNQYRFFDFPFTVGIERHRGSWVLHADAGVGLNILTRTEGDFLTPTGAITTFNDQTLAFKDRIGLSLIGSIGVNYKITNNLQWIIEPQVKYYLKPITVDDFPTTQQYVNFGLLTGLRIKISAD